MPTTDWSEADPNAFGHWMEYAVKMEFARRGFRIYSADVDDHGVDFVARHPSRAFIEVQVKALRKLNYIYVKKKHFELSDMRFLALVLCLPAKELEMFLIPATVWQHPAAPFVSYDYGGDLKSDPEWGLNPSGLAGPALEPFRLERQIARWEAPGGPG